MLEYLDFKKRKALLEIIYTAYYKEKSKSVNFGITKQEIIADWENFRYKWLTENIINKLKDNNIND